jgi:hypothetical protein
VGGPATVPVEDARRLGFERATPARALLAVPAGAGVRLARVEVAAVTLADALGVLLAGPDAVLPPWRRPPDSLRVWSLVARLGVAAVARRLIAPTLAPLADGRVLGVWRALVDADPVSRAAFERLAAAMPPAGHAIAAGEGSVPTPQALVRAVLDAIADLHARDGSRAGRRERPRARLLPWTARWLEALSDPDDAEVPLGRDAEELVAGVAGWHTSDALAKLQLVLHAPPDEEGAWRLEFGLRDDSGALLPAAQVWAGVSGDGADPIALQEALLEGLGTCARVFPPLDAALASPEPEGIDLSLHDAWRFLHDAVGPLAAADVVVRLPEELAEDALRLQVRVDTRDGGQVPAEHDAVSALVASDEEAWLRWEVTLDGEPLGDAALRTMLEGDRPLLLASGRWVRVDPELRAQVEALGDVRVTLGEALLHGLAGSMVLEMPGAGEGARTGPQVDVVCDGRMARLVARLREVAEPPGPGASPDGFTGELRPYQRRGVAWLGGMSALGLGAVLADAMGLGKTVQLIAHLLARPGTHPHLVICPTSVVGNWERELARFAPGLPVTRFHGPERPADLQGVSGVVVTSYGLLRREPEPLVAVDWDVVTLDEAQHVKNPLTAGARAVRKLRARQVVAMTGTPLENRLGELWAVLDATNPGLLGSRARFGRRFVAPVEQRQDPAASGRLRRIVAPFVLRREKRDVLDDLPDKIEREVPCTLTEEQAALYATALERALGRGALAAASPMQRRGRVLALLTALKQICNHPAQYLREGADADLLGRSGKLAVTREIVAEAASAGERVLLFTQYVEMGRLLVARLSADLGRDVPMLHGGVTAPARDRMVAAFQGEGDVAGVLVVSLRAGGTGLNLTAATQVVHYDRWWNPAVEDQATDRAHRIGQRRTVEVHKLVTAGTVEERIAAMLERKRALADAVIGSGEQWITELGDAELRELVALSAQGEELDEDGVFERVAWDGGPGMEEAS